MIYVLIWFDVEDYFSPQSDDADLQAAELASRAGVPVTFKIVGEKARALERNGRHDVIQALSRHSLGYHTDWHSRPPTLAAYLSELDWQDGANEFERRESAGFYDVRRIFGHDPVCFGQPGSSWAPQIYPVLKKWKIPLYLDEALHVGLPTEQPFWFQGMLHVFNLRRNAIKMEFGSQESFRSTCELFQSAHDRLSKLDGGLISLYYHPQEFIYRQFQDEVNFGRGVSRDSSDWRISGQRDLSEIQASYGYYEQFLKYLGGFDRVRFVDAVEVLKLYAEEELQGNLSPEAILDLAADIQREVTFQQVQQSYISAAESFEILVKWAFCHLGLGPSTFLKTDRSLLGPESAVSSRAIEGQVAWSEFEGGIVEAASSVEQCRRVPSAVHVGNRAASPQDFVANLAAAIESMIRLGSRPKTIQWRSANFTVTQYAAPDSPELWTWPIFPIGFHAPKLMKLASLQTWTIKPARLDPVRTKASESKFWKPKAIVEQKPVIS